MKTLCITIILLVLKIGYTFAEDNRVLVLPDPPLHFTDLAKQYGHRAEMYDVLTEDGYILGLFRIRGEKGLPILLMHGLLDTSDTWLLRGNKSLGITLANRGNDVWFGNIRGNRYSRFNLDITTKNSSFFDYSFHEHGYYDLPAIIDTVLRETKANKLNAIGQSQGTTIFFVMGSTRPTYNSKVNLFIALAPVCYLDHIPPPLSLMIAVAPKINAFVESLNVEELFGQYSDSGKIVNFICNLLIIKYPACAVTTLAAVTGYDLSQFEPEFADVAFRHFYDATTRKNLYHYAQVSRRGKFANYNYGLRGNLRKYKSISPPRYNLKKVTMPVILLIGMNDKLSLRPDVDKLYSELPNVLEYKVVPRPEMSHLDFNWGKDMDQYLFPLIFDSLDKYGQ